MGKLCRAPPNSVHPRATTWHFCVARVSCAMLQLKHQLGAGHWLETTSPAEDEQGLPLRPPRRRRSRPPEWAYLGVGLLDGVNPHPLAALRGHSTIPSGCCHTSPEPPLSPEPEPLLPPLLKIFKFPLDFLFRSVSFHPCVCEFCPFLAVNVI